MGGVDKTPPADQSPKKPVDDGSAARQNQDPIGKPLRRKSGDSEAAGGALETDLTNQQIGRYLIQRKLGSGGSAVVYQAYDQVRGRSVALKVLASTADEKMLLRFRREAMTSGALHHPNIVRTLQVGVAPHGDAAYIAMELVEGESLSALLERCGYLDSDEAAALLAPIAKALSHAHENEIIHRDVKPSNILLQPSGVANSRIRDRGSRDGQDGGTAPRSNVHIDVLDYPVIPMLSDFGIARSLDSPELTNQGRTVGTPAFMAPEQCAGQRDIDGRADVYSLGAVLYRCVVGRQPFLGATPQILHAHVYEPLTIDDDILRRLPPLVVEILIRSMAKQPDERYANALEMAAALAEAGGYELELPAEDSLPTPTATITLDNLPSTAGVSSSSASILVPGTVSDKSGVASGSNLQTQIGENNESPRFRGEVFEPEPPDGYYEPQERRGNFQRWSSLALLFVGVLVGAFTALYASGAFTRLNPGPEPESIVTGVPTVSNPQTSAEETSAAITILTSSPDTPDVDVTEAALTVATPTASDGASVDVDSSPTASQIVVTLVPTPTPVNPPTNTPTATPLSTATPLPTSTATETSTTTPTALPTNTPVVPPSPTWTPPSTAPNNTATLPPTNTPDAEAATAVPTGSPTATFLPPTPTWTPVP